MSIVGLKDGADQKQGSMLFVGTLYSINLAYDKESILSPLGYLINTPTDA